MRKELVWKKPPIMKRHLLLSGAIFFSSIVAGLIMISLQSTVQDPFGFGLMYPGEEIQSTFGYGSTMGYFVHNSSIAIAAWVSGLSIIGPLYILWENGMNIASYLSQAFVGSTMTTEQKVAHVAFLFPHGIFEIPAILLSLATSLYIAEVTGRKWILGENVSIEFAFKKTLPLVLFAVLLLLIAAVIEANFSRDIANWLGGLVA